MIKEETKVKKYIFDILKETGGYWINNSGGLFVSSGIPDIIGCYNGRFISFEIKTKSGKLSKVQKRVNEDIVKNKGSSFVISVDNFKNNKYKIKIIIEDILYKEIVSGSKNKIVFLEVK